MQSSPRISGPQTNPSVTLRFAPIPSGAETLRAIRRDTLANVGNLDSDEQSRLQQLQEKMQTLSAEVADHRAEIARSCRDDRQHFRGKRYEPKLNMMAVLLIALDERGGERGNAAFLQSFVELAGQQKQLISAEDVQRSNIIELTQGTIRFKAADAQGNKGAVYYGWRRGKFRSAVKNFMTQATKLLTEFNQLLEIARQREQAQPQPRRAGLEYDGPEPARVSTAAAIDVQKLGAAIQAHFDKGLALYQLYQEQVVSRSAAADEADAPAESIAPQRLFYNTAPHVQKCRVLLAVLGALEGGAFAPTWEPTHQGSPCIAKVIEENPNCFKKRIGKSALRKFVDVARKLCEQRTAAHQARQQVPKVVIADTGGLGRCLRL